MFSRGLTRFRRGALLSAAMICYARAGVLLDTGYLSFSATGTQFGRIGRDGSSSTWGSDKLFPGTTGAPAARGYQAFTVNSGPYQFLQISLDDPFTQLFAAAYLNSFNPVNSPPDFGLNVNYLGDPGSSQPFGNPSFFQIEVARNSVIVIPINEVNPGAGAGTPFNLIVEGFVDADFGEVPEPGSVWLFAAGIAVIAVLRARVFGSAARQVPHGGSSK